MNNQMNDKSHALTGAHNGRLDKVIRSDSQSTAAWVQAAKNSKKSDADLKNEGSYAAQNAKEWVDNGSRL